MPDQDREDLSFQYVESRLQRSLDYTQNLSNRTDRLVQVCAALVAALIAAGAAIYSQGRLASIFVALGLFFIGALGSGGYLFTLFLFAERLKEVSVRRNYLRSFEPLLPTGLFHKCGDAKLVTQQAGIVYLPVSHDGNSQCSMEEVETIKRVVDELLTSEVQDFDRSIRPLTLDDILIVAPYNMQVRRLIELLGQGAHVGTVDRFQGLEAHVVIVSMAASSLDESPRGAEFLMSPNRINVAVSRAKSLAIVVSSPELMRPRCQTIKQMELANLFCWLKDYATAV